MSEKFVPSVKNVSAELLKFRWFTCNCFQFLLPGGKSFVIDPMLVREGEPVGPFQYIGYDVDDLGSADYVFVNHAHGDHIASLKETYDKYEPRILAQDTTAAVLSRDLDIPHTAFFPYTWYQTYDFGDFTLSTLPARHNGKRRPSERFGGGMGAAFEEAGSLGTLFNTNFIMETANHLRIGFCAGTFLDGEIEKNCWKGQSCNIFIRQYGGRVLRNDPEGLAKEFMETGASLLLPMHQERFYSGALEGDIDALNTQVNQILEREGYAGRALLPQCGRWYSFGFGATAAE